MAKTPLIPTPAEYTKTKLYMALEERDSQKHTGLRQKVDDFITEVTPLLETIGSTAFHDYTLHKPVHSRKLLHLAGYIIPDETLEKLSQLELAVLIMAFYFHDVGMVVSEVRKEEVLSSDEFKLYLETHKEFRDKIESLRREISIVPEEQKHLYEEHLAQILYAAVTQYLRPKHANKDVYEKALAIIERHRQDFFTYGGTSFREEFVLLCHSHNEPASFLNKQDPTSCKQILQDDIFCQDQRLNVQYCAAVLRLTDILDFDAERTPEALFLSLGIEDKKLPGFKVSLVEWLKQMSVHSIIFTDREIEVHSECFSPTVEHSVKEMCANIEREIRDTSSFIAKAPKEVSDDYKLNLPLIVTPVIKRRNYADKEYAIHLEESEIMTLLMGENLYDRAQVALRELIQNSIDACVLLSKIDPRVKPQIDVSVSRDSDGRVWLVVRDNGIGMDDNVLSNYFFKIGKSYYKSADFKKFSAHNSITGFTPISRFGIGILSVFMIGDALKVTTQNLHSSNSDTKNRTIIIDMESWGMVQETTKNEQGTTIELRLKREYSEESYIQSLFEYVKSVFIHPAVPISMTDLNGSCAQVEEMSFNAVSDEKKEMLKQNGIEVIELDLSTHSNLVRGLVTLILFVNADDNSLSFRDKSGKHMWGQGLLKYSDLMSTGPVRSRITVNGVQMHMKKLSTLLTAGRHRFYSFMDIEVEGIDEIEYDVTRSKIVGDSRKKLKKEIKSAIASAFKDSDAFGRLDNEAKVLYKALFKDCCV